MPEIETAVAENLRRVRKETPLVHHITNLVVTNVTANVSLAIGASPVMAHAQEEVAQMVRFARALVLNIGTLTPATVDAMLTAGQEANRLGVPVVLDPVGAGATDLRTKSTERLLSEVKVTVLRGNAGEIATIGGYGGRVRGVDSLEGSRDMAAMVSEMARHFGTVVAATGKTDYISDGQRVATVHNGHLLLTTVTGTGCMVTSVIGAFVGVGKDPLLATAGALAYYGLAAEIAAREANGPASFQVALIDTLYNMTEEELSRGARIRIAPV
ncbi:MAG: hydroxyethylthiazole kinase [Firmicutes bacterium]|nr:hydroxyethylthiazole kinase [Bacillota bacterium]MCL5038850.1 hydroxyethylthiazole kinase [Bacillota bacterium]